MKKILYIFILVLVLFLVSCSKNEASKIEIVGNDTIEVGFDSEYKVLYEGNERDFSDFYWIIDNTTAVSRLDNVLTGLEAGTVNLRIVLKEDAKIFAMKEISVIDSIVNEVYIRGYKEKADVGNQFIVSIYTEPSDALSNVTCEWFVDNDIVTIDPADDSAIITCMQKGTCTISVKCSSATASFTLNIYEPITEIEMYNDDEICVDCAMNLNFNIDDAVIEVLSDNVEVNGMYLYATSKGVASIKVSQKNNKNLPAKTFTINVVDNKQSEDATAEEMKIINDYLSKMSTKEKLGQMFVLDLKSQNTGWRRVEYNFSKDENGAYYYANNDESSKKYIKALIKSYPFGNFNINSSVSTKELNISNSILGMQNYFVDSLKIGGIICVDMGDLGEGFNTYLDNLALGTINNFDILQQYYQVLGKDIKSSGINTIISPIFSTYGSSSSKYSNLKDKQILYSTVYKDELDKYNISVSPYYVYGSENDYILSAVNSGIEIITIDNYNDISVSSKNYLRENGYKGLIYDTGSHYDPENGYQYEGSWVYEDEFYYLDSYYINAINSGVNLFRINMFFESENDRWNYRSEARNGETFNFLANLEELVNAGTINISAINDSVSKILLYKLRNNLIEGTYPDDEYSKNDDNQRFINNVDDGYNTIAIEGEYHSLKKKNEINIIFDSGEISSLIGNASYISRGYRNLNRYQITKDNLFPEADDEGINKISSSSTVIMFVEGDTYFYSETVTQTYGDQSYTYTVDNPISPREVYDIIAQKCQNIILVFMDDPDVSKAFSDIDCLKIYTNYCAWDNLNPLFDVFEKNKATGVCMNEK